MTSSDKSSQDIWRIQGEAAEAESTAFLCKAFDCYMKAAELGDAVSQTRVGLMYRKGAGVEANFAQAAVWIGLAARQGHAWGQYQLGILHESGKGVRQDAAEAVKWYVKAADQGVLEALASLSLMYRDGRGVEKDEKKADELIGEAASREPRCWF